jgi:ATP-dependent helicase HrpB
LILSTNVAESSVTIEGVTAVIDSGLARIAAQSPWSGLPRLTMSRVSRASADQRAGRAGRTAPGRAIRLYTEHDYVRRPAHDTPEILRAELSPVVLELAALGATSLEWLDPPPAAALDAGRDLLFRLGALDAEGRLTQDGRRMAALPLHPRLARLVLSGGSDDAVRAAAVLSTGERLSDSSAHGPSDLLALAERDWAPRTRQVYQQIRRQASSVAVRRPTSDESFLEAVLAAFPDRVARRRRGDQLLLSNGGSAVLDTHSLVRDREFIVAVDVEERSDRAVPLVRLASAIDPGWLLDLFPDRVRETVSLEWNREAERVEETRVLLYDQLAIDETYGAPSDPDAAAQLLAERALNAGLARFADGGELQHLRNRIGFAACKSGIEPLSDDEVQETVASLCVGLRSFAELERRLRDGALVQALEARRPARLMNQIAPARIRLPGGKYANVNYAEGQTPWVAAKLQEFFGMTSSPTAGGQPIVLHLLAPNNRPVQTTTDLAGFWKRLYPELRRELGRRYPRHRWPEDPLAAAPGERIRRPRP